MKRFLTIAILLLPALFACNKNSDGNDVATGVTLSTDKLDLLVGQTATLTATVLPESLKMGVVWSVIDETYAEVKDGVVTAKAEGVTYVVATSADGNRKASCMISVNPELQYSVSIKDETGLLVTSIYGYPGLTKTLRATTSDGEPHIFTWSLDDESAGTITSNGVLTLGATESTNASFIYDAQTSLKVVTEDGCGCKIPIRSSLLAGLQVGDVFNPVGTPVIVQASETYPVAVLCQGELGTVEIPVDAVSYELSNNSSYSSTWWGNAIQVIDVLTDELLDSWTILNGKTATGTLAVCNGRQIRFEWKKRSGSEQCSYTVYDNNGDVIFSGYGPLDDPVTHTVDCTPYLTKPTALECTATPGGTTATLGWTENGTATAWQISVLDGSSVETIIDANSNPFTVEGLTNNTFYTAKVRATGNNIVSKWSDAITFEATSKVRIGTGTTTSNIFPANIYYKYGLSEQIYTPAELGSEARNIESIDFYKNATNGTPTCNLDIYMVLTTKNSFNNYKDWVSVTSGDLVFSGSVTFAADAWTTITLDTPFEYDGESNVLLVVDNNTGSYGSQNSFYTFSDGSYRSLCYPNNSDIDPTGDLSSYSGNIQNVKNQIRIEFGAASAVPKPAGLQTENVSYHMARLAWTEKGTATAWQLCVNDDETNLINVTEIPYTMTGLSANTAYTVKVRAVNGEETSRWAGPISFTTKANPAPSFLDTGLVGPYTAEIEWWDNGDAESWQICLNGDETNLISVTPTDPSGFTQYYTLTNLTPQTDYVVKVRGVIPGETCPWSDDLQFTALETNPVPFDIIASTRHTSATVSWTGFSDSYKVRYRKAAGVVPVFSEDFEAGGNSGWTKQSCDSETEVCAEAAHSGNYGFKFYYNTNPPQYLISPELTGVTDGMVLQFYYMNYNSSYPETFQIGFSSTTNDIDAFTFGDEMTASDEQWHLYNSAIPEGTKYVCWKLTSYDKYFLFIDDIVIGSVAEVGEWQEEVTVNEATAVLTGLTAATLYECQVRGIIGDAVSEWSESGTFTTRRATTKIFIAEGNWNGADNWEPAGVPTIDNDVVIMANVTIPSGVVAMATNITIEGMSNGGGSFARSLSPSAKVPAAITVPTITLKDGGQLRHRTADLPVIVEKNITGYGSNATGSYRLLAYPFNDVAIPELTNGMDLYQFETAPADGKEWRNFMAESFYLTPNDYRGYLFASADNQTLSFAGPTYSNIGTTFLKQITVNGDKKAFSNGWALFGNLFTCNAYLQYEDDSDNVLNANFYKLNAAGDGFTLYKNYVEVAPGEAVFVEVAETGYVSCYSEPIYTAAPVAEEGTYNMPWLPQHGLTAHQDAHVVLADASDNTNLITTLNGKTVSVVLNGRTLYRDGYWNTLTLPFNLTLADSPLAGATARPLSKGSITGTTLNLTFGDAVAELVAGTPYIIMWAEANTNIVNPVFSGVTVSSATNNYDSGAGDGDLRVRFLGTYKSTEFTTTDQSILFIGAENMLYYPEPSGGQNPVIGACRAFFKIGNDSQGARQLTAFNIDFGDETNGIENVHRSTFNVQSESWFTVDGRKLNGKPARAGVYINNGRKVVIK